MPGTSPDTVDAVASPKDKVNQRSVTSDNPYPGQTGDQPDPSRREH
jgi:hypothetical protein